tara:strand:+ start:39708 stop:40355 length:648 start_codon:yes stop_codon:yes gene_type:complete
LIKNKKGIIFDLDGTLVDSLEDIANAVNETLNELGLPRKNNKFIKSAIGSGAKTLLNTCLPPNVLVDEKIYKMFLINYNSETHNQSKLYPGVLSFLEKSADIRKAVLTNKPIEPALKIIKKLKINKYFEKIVGLDNVNPPKPDPSGLNTILTFLELSPDQAIMIGDGFQDIRVANNVKMDSIAILDRIGDNQLVLSQNPTYTVKNFFEISDMFFL